MDLTFAALYCITCIWWIYFTIPLVLDVIYRPTNIIINFNIYRNIIKIIMNGPHFYWKCCITLYFDQWRM